MNVNVHVNVNHEEACTGIAVCVFIGHDPQSWLVESHEFSVTDEAKAAECAITQRRMRGPRVVVTVRRFTRVFGSSQRSEWRVDGSHHVIVVESEDFGV